jgi:hypothetical protein
MSNAKIKPSDVVDWIRTQLKAGNTIRATNPDGRVLEFMDDGTVHSGLTITGPDKAKELEHE